MAELRQAYQHSSIENAKVSNSLMMLCSSDGSDGDNSSSGNFSIQSESHSNRKRKNQLDKFVEAKKRKTNVIEDSILESESWNKRQKVNDWISESQNEYTWENQFQPKIEPQNEYTWENKFQPKIEPQTVNILYCY